MSLKKLSRQHIVLLILALLMAQALFWSKWLIGLFVFLTFFYTFIDWDSFRIRADLKRQFFAFVKTPEYALLTLFFMATPISSLIHQEGASIWNDMLLKLPYLTLPFAYFVSKPLSKDWVGWFSTFLIWISSLFCLGVLIHFLIVIDQSIEAISVGKAISTPESHIRFSLIVSLSILFATLSLIDRQVSIRSTRGIFIGICILFNFIFLHILAVKSGLMTTYLGLFFIVTYILVKEKKYILSFVTLLVLTLIPIVGYQTSPTLRQKIHYTLYDWKQLDTPGPTEYSDVERLRSVNFGLDVFRENPWTGTGRSDLEQEIKTVYVAQHGSMTKNMTPHNQFVYILASMGVLGSLLCFPGIIYPFLCKGLFRNPFLIAAGITIGASCMVEATLETSVGMNLHLLFVLIGLSMMDKQLRKP